MCRACAGAADVAAVLPGEQSVPHRPPHQVCSLQLQMFSRRASLFVNRQAKPHSFLLCQTTRASLLCSFEIKGGDQEHEGSTATPGPGEASAAPSAAPPPAAEGGLSEEQVASGRLWSARVVLVSGVNSTNLQARFRWCGL